MEVRLTVVNEATIKKFSELPVGQHQFSYLVIYQDANNVVHYYELRPRYHYLYPSRRLFGLLWERWRTRLKASQALERRAVKIFARARIRIKRVHYMTTMVVYEQGRETIDFYRHIVAVSMSDKDLVESIDSGYLRLLHEGDNSPCSRRVFRDKLYQLIPFANRKLMPRSA